MDSPSNMRMLKPVWLLTRSIALSVIVNVGVATAQTVIVRGAPPGVPIQVQVEGNARSATADASGDATFTVPVPGGSADASVQVFVDRCDNEIHAQIIRRGVPLPVPAAGCTRGEIWGAFRMGAITTFVVDVDTPSGAVHVRQGPPPRSWLTGAGESQERSSFETPPPAGFTLWAGAGISRDTEAITTLCGNAAACTGDNYTAALAAGATYWIKPMFGVQAAVARRAQAEARGTGSTYRFDSTVETGVFTISGVAGLLAGPVRIYGEAGVNRHRATFATKQTTDDLTVVVNNVSQTIPGGTQTLKYTTEGWGWQFGAGLEAWAKRFIAIYADGQYVRLDGSDVTGGEAHTDQPMFLLTAGVRVRIGK